MKALILENIVVEVASVEFEVAPTLEWKDCPDEVQTGWSVLGDTFTAPIPTIRLDFDGINPMPEWKIGRIEAYPSLTDQADMAYWDRQNGTTTLDDAIAAVKDANPKP